MRQHVTLLALTVALAGGTALGRPTTGDSAPPSGQKPPGRSGRAAEGLSDSRPSPNMQRDMRARDAQNWRGPRGQGRLQPGFGPGPQGWARQGNRDFNPPAGPRGRGFNTPPMMNPNRSWGRGQFVPPTGRGQGQRNLRQAPGSMRRGFGGPPAMSRRGFNTPPMMNPNRSWGRGQFVPPMGRGQGQHNLRQAPGPMRRGFGGPPMMNGRGPQSRGNVTPPGLGQGRPQAGPMLRGQRPGMGQNQRLGPPWQRGANRGYGPQYAPGRGRN